MYGVRRTINDRQKSDSQPSRSISKNEKIKKLKKNQLGCNKLSNISMK